MLHPCSLFSPKSVSMIPAMHQLLIRLCSQLFKSTVKVKSTTSRYLFLKRLRSMLGYFSISFLTWSQFLDQQPLINWNANRGRMHKKFAKESILEGFAKAMPNLHSQILQAQPVASHLSKHVNYLVALRQIMVVHWPLLVALTRPTIQKTWWDVTKNL